MSQVEVRKIEAKEYQLWDNLVSDSPQGTIFHISDWIKTCSSLLNKKCLLLGYFEDNELRGGCSMYVTPRLKLWNFATSTVSMTPYGGFLLPTRESTNVRGQESKDSAIIIGILNRISRYRFDYINITNPPSFHDIRPFTWNDWTSSVYYTYIFSLTEDISLSVSKKVRNTVRKAEKNKIHIRKYYDPDLYWILNIKTYEKQNLKPPFTKAFLTGMLNMIIEKNIGEMWVAETESGEVASAEIITWDNKMAHRWSAASNTSLKETGATSLLLYEILKDLQMREFKEINLMAGNTPNLAQFISSFNPKLVPYYSVKKFKNWGAVYDTTCRLLQK